MTDEVKVEKDEAKPADDKATDSKEDVKSDEYSPNYEYNILGKTYSFDEELRPFVKDKDSEAKIRELHEKAGGLDHYKDKVSKKDTELEEINSRASKAQEEIMKFKSEKEELEYLKETDPLEYCSKLGIDPFAITATELEKEDWSDEQRKLEKDRTTALDDKRKAEKEKKEMEDKIEALEGENAVKGKAEFQKTMDSALDTPEVTTLTKQGIDVKEQVIEMGLAHFQRTGKDIPIDEAVKRVLGRYSHMEKKPAHAEDKNTIVNPGNSKGSPAASQISSVEDLQKLYKEKYA